MSARNRAGWWSRLVEPFRRRTEARRRFEAQFEMGLVSPDWLDELGIAEPLPVALVEHMMTAHPRMLAGTFPRDCLECRRIAREQGRQRPFP